jgi:hypothetical protein
MPSFTLLPRQSRIIITLLLLKPYQPVLSAAF